MNTAMKTTFLSDQDLSSVQSILEQHGLDGFDASVRLWGRGKAIEVNGTLGRRELSCLLAIARFLGDSGEDMSVTDARSDKVVSMPLPHSDVTTMPGMPMRQAAAA